MTTERTALQAGIDFIVPVWGSEYTRCFTEICLPTFLAPGNIPALPYPDRHVFQIYTTPRDRAAIEASPAYHQLVRHMRVNFHRVRVAEPTRSLYPLSVQSDCYRRAIRAADAADRAMFFMTPDMIIADGSLRNLATIADRPNVRAVLSTGVRLVKETVATELLAQHRVRDDAIAIGPRPLVRMMLRHIHPMARAHFYRPNEGTEAIGLSNLYWRVDDEGIVARCFHLHPFLVYPRVKNAPFSSTVDGDYIESACPDVSETYICSDSDEFCVCELSPASRTAEPYPRNTPLSRFVRWMRDSTTPRHRVLITRNIRLHGDISDAELWRRTETEAGEVVSALLAHLRAAIGDASPDLGSGYVDAAKAKVPLHFTTVIRSEAEAHCFAQVTVPSLLSPANIAIQVNKRFCTYRIVATAAARAIVEASPALAELGEHLRIDIETRDGAAMRQDGFAETFRRERLAEALKARAAVVFLEPDMVLCDKGLAIINAVLDLKMRAMLAPRLRLRRADAMPLLRDMVIENVLSINPHDLVALALDHLHPLTALQFRDRVGPLMDPETLCWRVGDEGALVHAFDYAPIMIFPRDDGTAPDPVDHPLFGPLGFSANEISIIRDSKAFVQCQLSDESDEAALPPPGDAAAIAAWAKTHTGAFQRLMFRNEIRLLATDTPSRHWGEVAAAANAEVLRILAGIEQASPQPKRA
jgi:hypothetical protein